MEQILEFLSKLTDTSSWPPRWICGEWTEFHGWLYIISDVFIWIAYFFIPIFLLSFILKKDTLPFPRVFWLFGAFILLCGLTHLMDAILFYWPAYRLSALIRFATAVVSIATMIALFKYFPKALKLRTSAEFGQEIAERQKVENKLRETQQKLEQQNKLLQVQNHEIQQFAYTVSHDLKEPLQSFTSVVDLLKGKIKPADQETQDYFDFLQESSQRMRAIIVDLLDHSRLGNSKHAEPVNLNDIIKDILADLRGLIDRKSAKIEVKNLPTLPVYRTELRLLLQNLIHNALKFTKAEEHPKVELGFREEADHFLFWVQDEGIGIEAENLDNIFNIFTRGPGSEEHEGSGIGLANAKRVVELHQGKIWVESEPGKGSRFYFTIRKNLPSDDNSAS